MGVQDLHISYSLQFYYYYFKILIMFNTLIYIEGF